MSLKLTSACIQIQKGDKLLYEGDVVTVMDTVLVPNGAYSPEIVCLIYAERETTLSIISATSEKFSVILTEDYTTFFPSIRGSELCNKIINGENNAQEKG